MSQADLDSMKNNYAGASTSLASTPAASASATATTSSTSAPLDESIRLPLPVEVKQEKEDDIPYMVIDNPSDTEVKTFPGDAMFGGDQDSSNVYAGDPSSMSQSAYGVYNIFLQFINSCGQNKNRRLNLQRMFDLWYL